MHHPWSHYHPFPRLQKYTVIQADDGISIAPAIRRLDYARRLYRLLICFKIGCLPQGYISIAPKGHDRLVRL